MKHILNYIRTNWLVILLIVCGIFLRLYRLADVPHGMAWDEAAIGYNGFSIQTTRRDEWLEFMPISFRSFGDYKAPLAIYLSAVTTFIFGNTLLAVRVISAVSGVLALIIFYKLIRCITQKNKYSRSLSAAALGLTAFSPWHLHFSRIGFESNLALTLLLMSITSIFYSQRKLKGWRQIFALLASGAFASASMYAYHSSKLVAPLLWLAVWLLLLDRSIWKQKLRSFVLASTSATLFSLPLIYDSIFGKSLARANSLITHLDLSTIETIELFIKQFLIHISPNFLIMGATDTLRHGTGVWGVLLLPTYVLCVSAFFFRISKQQKYQKQHMLFALGVIWVLIGTLPAALGISAPHPNRALLALPGYLLLATYSAAYILSATSNIFRKQLISVIILISTFNFIAYTNYYYTTFAMESAEAFNDGYLEVFKSIESMIQDESNGGAPVSKVIFSNEYGQAYVYALYSARTTPIEYQHGALARYEFLDSVGSGHLRRENTVLVVTQNTDLHKDWATHIITGSDGQMRFMIGRSDPNE